MAELVDADPNRDDDVVGEDLSWAELINALLEHTPGPVLGVPLTGREVCRRADQSQAGRLREPMLSSLRRGRAVEPGFGIIVAVADGSGVGIASSLKSSITSTAASRWHHGCGQPTLRGCAGCGWPPTSSPAPDKRNAPSGRQANSC